MLVCIRPDRITDHRFNAFMPPSVPVVVTSRSVLFCTSGECVLVLGYSLLCVRVGDESLLSVPFLWQSLFISCSSSRPFLSAPDKEMNCRVKKSSRGGKQRASGGGDALLRPLPAVMRGRHCRLVLGVMPREVTPHPPCLLVTVSLRSHDRSYISFHTVLSILYGKEYNDFFSFKNETFSHE